MACFKVERHGRDEIEGNEKYFIKNGGVLLKELVAFSNGRSNPISHFSANEILRATNNYDPNHICLKDLHYILYQGFLNDRPIFVKKYNKIHIEMDFAAIPYKDIAIGSRMSVHKNVLKVIGNCLETEIPSIVYEFAGTRILSQCISVLPWKCRLKIAADLANAFAYLHTAFSRPVIHQDINSETILLDENNVPKLIDFGLCMSIPEGQSHVKDGVRGRAVFLAPEYHVTGYLREKADVYQFGVLLLELLTGQRLRDSIIRYNIWTKSNFCIEKLSNNVDPSVTGEGIELEQLLEFRTLLLRCICEDEELRPTMTDVGKGLRQIYQNFPPC